MDVYKPPIHLSAPQDAILQVYIFGIKSGEPTHSKLERDLERLNNCDNVKEGTLRVSISFFPVYFLATGRLNSPVRSPARRGRNISHKVSRSKCQFCAFTRACVFFFTIANQTRMHPGQTLHILVFYCTTVTPNNCPILGVVAGVRGVV